MYVCQLTSEIVNFATGNAVSENEVRQKREAGPREARTNRDECVSRFKKCHRDVLFS